MCMYRDGTYGWSSVALLRKVSLGRNTVLCLLGNFSTCYVFWFNHMQLHLIPGVLSDVHGAPRSAFEGGSEHK